MRTGSYRSSYNPIASSRRAARAASSCCCGCSPGTTTATTSSRRLSGIMWGITRRRCETGNDTAGRQGGEYAAIRTRRTRLRRLETVRGVSQAIGIDGHTDFDDLQTQQLSQMTK